MSELLQSNKHHQGRSADVHTPLSLSATSILASAVPRTLVLAATISLVAFVLYAATPRTRLSSADTADRSTNKIEAATKLSQTAAPVGPAQSQQHAESSHNGTVTINGADVPVPADGNLDKTVTDGNGTTTIHISSDGNGTSTNDVNINSSTSSSSGDGM